MKVSIRFLNYWRMLFSGWGFDFPFADLSVHCIKSGCSGTDYVGSYESTDCVFFITVLGFGVTIRFSTDLKWKPSKL